MGLQSAFRNPKSAIYFPRLGSYKEVGAFKAHLRTLSNTLSCDDEILTAPASPLAQPYTIGPYRLGNRWAIQPMEGWDGIEDGNPSALTLRRWRRFGESGAKLIWGGEAVAVCHEGRANPNQLYCAPHTRDGLARLRETLLTAHKARYGTTDDLLLGLQLTHSGRFCRPNHKDRLEPRIVYHHPLLDARFGIPPDYPVVSDGEIRRIIDDYLNAARMVESLGYWFVDVKHCHGYLGHEFLSAYTRPEPYGGSFEGRTRFLREIVTGIRAACPDLLIGVRLSAYDSVPFQPDPEQSTAAKPGPGIPVPFQDHLPYRYAFGVDASNPVAIDLTETFRLIALCRDLGVALVNLSAGSPYYNPHIQRPAAYPPSDGYQPPEDPLLGVVRQIEAAHLIKAAFPDLPMVGTAYSYLQEYLPHLAQWVVREGWIDFVGLGRMALSYPHLPGDVLATGQLDKKRLCRTFSDCTTAPRKGLVSGCYPLDSYYRDSPEGVQIKEIKRRL